ncbi:hypothetical protein [Secundilactobacillus muriivasis]
MDLNKIATLQRVPMPQTAKRTFESTAVIGEYITNMRDVQRSSSGDRESLIEQIQPLVASTRRFGTRSIILTNDDLQMEEPGLTITKVPLFTGYKDLTLYFHRWEMAFTFLKQHPEIEKVFFVDATDVQMCHYPFDQLEPGKLYFGDEYSDLSAQIIHDNAISEVIHSFLKTNQSLQLLNPGVVGGYRDIVMAFLGRLTVNIANIMATDQLTHRLGTIGRLEMALINYTAYHSFKNHLIHGRIVTSRFMFYESESTAWFRHK